MGELRGKLVAELEGDPWSRAPKAWLCTPRLKKEMEKWVNKPREKAPRGDRACSELEAWEELG